MNLKAAKKLRKIAAIKTIGAAKRVYVWCKNRCTNQDREEYRREVKIDSTRGTYRWLKKIIQNPGRPRLLYTTFSERPSTPPKQSASSGQRKHQPSWLKRTLSWLLS